MATTLTRHGDSIATLRRLDGPGFINVMVTVESHDSVDALIRVIGFPEGGYRVGDRFAVTLDKVQGL